MTQTADLPRLLTAREAAEHLRLSLDYVYRLAARGVLPAVRLTERSNLRFRVEDVEAVLASRCGGCGTSAPAAEAVEPAAEGSATASRGSSAGPSPPFIEDAA